MNCYKNYIRICIIDRNSIEAKETLSQRINMSKDDQHKLITYNQKLFQAICESSYWYSIFMKTDKLWHIIMEYIYIYLHIHITTDKRTENKLWLCKSTKIKKIKKALNKEKKNIKNKLIQQQKKKTIICNNKLQKK